MKTTEQSDEDDDTNDESDKSLAIKRWYNGGDESDKSLAIHARTCFLFPLARKSGEAIDSYESQLKALTSATPKQNVTSLERQVASSR